MRGFLETWKLTRERLEPAYRDLRRDQLLWRPHPEAHSIGELLYHVAGTEYYYAVRVSGRQVERSEWESRLDRALVAGFLADAPMPFGEKDMEVGLIASALEFSEGQLRPLLENLTGEDLERPIVTGMGDHLKGIDGLARVSMHAGYHTGQIWIYRMDPRFPK